MFKILSDSACDFSPEYWDSNDVIMVPLYLTYDGENYMKDHIDVSRSEFYDQMVNNGCFPKSSLPSVQDYIDYFMPHVQTGTPIICVTISTSLSGSYNSAMTARDEILEEYPDADIAVINSTTNTVTQALFVNEAVRMRNAGLSYEQTVDKLLKLADTTRIFFTIGSLDYMIRNGRIGKLALVLTNKIKIRPIITMKDNEIGLSGITRTRAKSLASVIEVTRKFLNDNSINKDDYYFVVGWGYDEQEGRDFIETAERELGITFLNDLNIRIGAMTICHTGPYPIGIGCIRKYETI